MWGRQGQHRSRARDASRAARAVPQGVLAVINGNYRSGEEIRVNDGERNEELEAGQLSLYPVTSL